MDLGDGGGCVRRVMDDAVGVDEVEGVVGEGEALGVADLEATLGGGQIVAEVGAGVSDGGALGGDPLASEGEALGAEVDAVGVGALAEPLDKVCARADADL